MKISDLSRCTLSVCIAILLAGCGGSQVPVGAPPLSQSIPDRAQSGANYRVLHDFGAFNDDGLGPEAGLIEVQGRLYGTTWNGGKRYPSGCGTSDACGGTVFRISTGGAEKLLYSFGRDPEANHPSGALIDVGGTLYGTAWGGAYGTGTIYSITLSGKEKVLHSFGNGTDGVGPASGLINVKGILYGTTSNGGAYGDGTVFSITTDGTEKVLHSFAGGTDGDYPVAGLHDLHGTLYGTTLTGGTFGNGTVFSITPSGTEKVLHNFGNGADGADPAASLIDVKGTLYGTTEYGGAYECKHPYAGCGTVFSITPSGTEKVLHSFGKGTDGAEPVASLIDVKGTLYGTTQSGGAHSCGTFIPYCRGTVFRITTNGKEEVLHNFNGRAGEEPLARLIDAQGTLYGTTYFGGDVGGSGVVFALTP